MAMSSLIIKIISLILLISICSIGPAYSFDHPAKHKNNESKKYALLIGGGATKLDAYDSFFRNIEYTSNALIKLGYQKENIKILFYGGQNPKRSIVAKNATKQILLEELNRLENKIDSNDSLLIFRTGHGAIDLVFEGNNALPRIKPTPAFNRFKCVGTTAVMIFPDGVLSCFDFQESLARIKAKQIIIILNQCFSDQFGDIALKLDNTVVVSQAGLAIRQTRETLKWKSDEWPFVKCLIDGFLHNNTKGDKQSVYNAFQYMIKCNPNIEGIPIKPDQPLLKEKPQIRYGKNLNIGAVYID